MNNAAPTRERLREARAQRPQKAAQRKLEIIRSAAEHAFPAPDIEYVGIRRICNVASIPA